MKTFPMFLKMEDRKVTIIGGGEQAAQKCRLMLKTDAEIVVVADTLEPELEGLKKSGQITSRPEPEGIEALQSSALVFVATGCKGADAAWHGIAKAQGLLVNVVDYPKLCDAYTPSIVDRDPVVIAIGTEGTAPVLGRQIKSQIENSLEHRLGELARIAGSLRGAVAQRIAPDQRRAFWRWVFNDAPRKLFADGAERDAVAKIKGVILKGQVPDAPAEAFCYTMFADPRNPDLMSIRDVKHLQEADVICFEDYALAPILEYARRDAERLCTADQKSPITVVDLAEDYRAAGRNVLVLRLRQSGSNVIDLSKVLGL